jgi:hypothetical protein
MILFVVLSILIFTRNFFICFVYVLIQFQLYCTFKHVVLSIRRFVKVTTNSPRYMTTSPDTRSCVCVCVCMHACVALIPNSRAFTIPTHKECYLFWQQCFRYVFTYMDFLITCSTVFTGDVVQSYIFISAD